MNYETVLKKAIEIAERGAAIALSYFRKALLLEIKDNGTPVTVADKKTEEWIRSEIERNFPSHGIIGEEFGEKGPHGGFQWVIDPIDGTRSFIRGIPLFGTLLALLEDGEPVIGVMVLPALGETYSAAKGQGTYCNGQIVRVLPASDFSNSIISIGDLSSFQDHHRFLELLEKRSGLCRTYTDCFGHALVMRGSADAMVDPLVSIWDVAALAVLVEEAGGTYYTFSGEKRIDGGSFITSSLTLKPQILALRN